MTCTLNHKGSIRRDEEWYHQYQVICDNGVVFDTEEDDYYKSGTRLVLSDDICMEDSGWVHWQCGSCNTPYWSRSRPGGEIRCPICGAVETVPLEAKMMPFEGADETDRLIAENET